MPTYRVRPGERLLMRVAVTVSAHVRVRALWLGIDAGALGMGPEDRPVGMHPILAHSRQPLSAGVHMFGLRWRVPRHLPPSGLNLYLSSAWSSHQPPASVSGAIAVLAPAQHVNRQLIWGGGLAPG